MSVVTFGNTWLWLSMGMGQNYKLNPQENSAANVDHFTYIINFIFFKNKLFENIDFSILFLYEITTNFILYLKKYFYDILLIIYNLKIYENIVILVMSSLVLLNKRELFET